MGSENTKTSHSQIEENQQETSSAPTEDIEKIANDAYLSLKEKCLTYLDASSEPILYKSF